MTPDSPAPKAPMQPIVGSIDAAISDLRNSQPKPRHPVGYQAELPASAAPCEAVSGQAQMRSPAPTSPPKRPKGRILVGSMLLALFTAGAFIVWDGLFRYQAYGIIEANRLEVRATVPGIVQRVYVSAGDQVKTGDLLVVLENHDFEQRLRRTRDELRLAESQLDATIAKLRWDAQSNAAELFELTGKLREHRAELQRLERSLERLTKLKTAGVITDEVFDQTSYAKTGKAGLIEMYEEAIANYQRRTNSASGEFEVPLEQLKPSLIKIENLQHEIELLQDEAQKSWIRAPLPGLVVKRPCLTGQSVGTAEVLLELIEVGSCKPVVYLSQAQTAELKPGSSLVIHVDPNKQPITCRVKRLGDEYIPAPPSLTRFYDMNEPLLPITLETETNLGLPPGAMIKVPHAMPKWREYF